MKTKILFLALAGVLICGCQAISPKAPATISLKTAETFAEKSNNFYQKAVNVYNEAIGANPKDNLARYYLGSLYYQHGEYDLAVKTLIPCEMPEAQKLLAMSYYKNGDYTEALSVFEKIGEAGNEDYLYSYAMTCERHNLYMNALKIYQKIHLSSLASLAQERIQKINALIEKTDVHKLEAEVQELIKNAPSQEKLPEAGAVILSMKEDTEVLSDNTVRQDEYYLVKILNERGKHLGVQAHPGCFPIFKFSVI
ncbi:MAG: tetratricopeptide repeat protein [Candidatus Omnitrophica bacterium]|nr:tetratricopeptide repeat protein [Candidatus Omnitrophota bacterium]